MTTPAQIRVNYTLDEWLAEGRRRFGPNFTDWRFICPICGNVASGQEFKDAGAPPNRMYQECIGRYRPNPVRGLGVGEERTGGPCDYAGYGLIQVSPITVTHPDGKRAMAFDFGPEAARE